MRRTPTPTILMRVSDDIRLPENLDRDRVARLEERIERIEAHLGLRPGLPVTPDLPPPALAPVFAERTTTGEELELELGQHWFALGGVAILTAGLAFLLSMPYPGLPSAIPSLAGFGLTAALLAIAHKCPRTFPGGAGCLRAAGMVLLGFSALRLFLFSAKPALELNTPVASGILFAVTIANLTIALRRHSPWLTGLALTIGGTIALAAGTTSLIHATIAAVAIATVAVNRKEHWPGLLLAGLVIAYLTYFVWAMGNPFRTGAVRFVSEPVWAPGMLLALIMVLGAAPLLRPREGDDAPTNIASFLNCALGYGVFLVHTAAVFPARFAALHVVAALALVGLAMAFFVRTKSRVSTFFYAMTGYAALTFAILKLSHAPDVFIWLSAQSVIVVATAIWFHSRFIVVANFFIFAAIVVSYIVVTRQESGISLVFGLVAVATARILNWQQHRLELKTDLMRNTYLASAFVIFPYAAYHLVPTRYVALAWVVVAAAYYLVNVIVKNPKYRWMGHGTLVMTTLYVIGMGVSRFEPIYRVLSFLVLGAMLLTVSLLFARARRRQARADSADESGQTGRTG